jgi:hypothetical protein
MHREGSSSASRMLGSEGRFRDGAERGDHARERKAPLKKEELLYILAAKREDK